MCCKAIYCTIFSSFFQKRHSWGMKHTFCIFMTRSTFQLPKVRSCFATAIFPKPLWGSRLLLLMHFQRHPLYLPLTFFFNNNRKRAECNFFKSAEGSVFFKGRKVELKPEYNCNIIFGRKKNCGKKLFPSKGGRNPLFIWKLAVVVF